MCRMYARFSAFALHAGARCGLFPEGDVYTARISLPHALRAAVTSALAGSMSQPRLITGDVGVSPLASMTFHCLVKAGPTTRVRWELGCSPVAVMPVPVA